MNPDLMPEYIEIETSTYCNRRCSWCPNSVYDRGTSQRLMDQQLFKKILADLGNLQYTGEIALHNYNEPLLDPNINSNIRLVGEYVPSAKKLVLTNGDFLTRKRLEELVDLDVSLVRVSLYKPMNSKSIEQAERLQSSLGLEKGTISRSAYGISISSNLSGTTVRHYIPNRDRFTSRGGILGDKGTDLDSFCFLPFSSCAIDVDAYMKICCEIYPQNAEHFQSGIVGSLATESFEDLWLGDMMNKIRKALLHYERINPICATCEETPKSASKINHKKLSAWREHIENDRPISD